MEEVIAMLEKAKVQVQKELPEEGSVWVWYSLIDNTHLRKALKQTLENITSALEGLRTYCDIKKIITKGEQNGD